MKYVSFIMAMLFVSGLEAGTLSTCHEKCFHAKHSCNSNRGHTFNPCDHDLFTCKASCNSGKKQEKYSTKLPIDIAFQPVLDGFDMLKLVKLVR